MQESTFTWPNVAQTIQTRAESVTGLIDSTMADALAKLRAIEGDASYGRHPLGSEAQALLGLRGDLESLLNQGTVISATPYQFQVGDKQKSGVYLNPKKAVKTLVAKLRDHVDKNRPAGQLYCIVLLVSESQPSAFAATLNSLATVLPLPDWCQAARQATALSTNAVDKFYQSAAISQPRFKPQANLNANPLREYLKQQGSQLATLESLASDKTNVIDKLQALAEKRSCKLDGVSASINALKTLTGSVWTMSLNGSAESVATQLSQMVLPNNNQHTVASLLLSPQPLTFLRSYCAQSKR